MVQPTWSFRDYLNEKQRNMIRSWLDGLGPRAKAEINVRLRFIQTLDRLVRPYTGALRQGIFEVRVKSGNVQYRPLFCHGPESGDLTLLIGAEEHDDKLTKGVFDEALRRKEALKRDPTRSCKHDFG